MTLPAGTKLGPYEILSPIGAGGMGEVYRARDARLEREVAVKVLPEALASDRERLKRFEKEARSASALNHPNIVTIHDIGSESGISYIAMELVDGATLREQLASGPLPIKKLLQIAPQVAEGLARAHEAGIVHRDLKPENVMVKKDGLVKILDFGLAKLSSTGSGSDEASQLPTMTGTLPGVVVGTVSYMSPEQASGQPVDYRSDQFSLGSMLYEMATGKRAFQKKTAIDTLAAILNEEPEAVAPQTPAPIRWIVARCLAKEPHQRYAATEDLARELANVRDHITEVSSSTALALPAMRSRVPRILGAVGMAALLVSTYFLASARSRAGLAPRLERVSFQKGWVGWGRFAPDGQTVVYGMSNVGSDSKPVELYSTRLGSLDSRPLGLPSANLYSISHTGEMAICLIPASGPRIQGTGAWSFGTLAGVSLSGGAPRPILEDVRGAAWSPDGKELAVVHEVGGKSRVEYPIGKVIYASPDYLDGPLHVSPDGQTVAFQEGATLRTVNRKGLVRTLVSDSGENGGNGCWSSRGDELWWLKNFGDANTEVHAVTPNGSDRIVTSLGGDFGLHDLSSDGRMLVERVHQTFEMLGSFPGENIERSLMWLDLSAPAALSADGRTLLFSDRGNVGDTRIAASYLRRTDGSPAVRLGEGQPVDLSPDGKWALVRRELPKPHLVLLPTGAGEEKEISSGTTVVFFWAQFHPDGKHILLLGAEPGHKARVFEQSLEGGPQEPVTPEGIGLGPLSQDGAQLATLDQDSNLLIFSMDHAGRTVPRTVTRLSENEEPLHWSADGRSLLIINRIVRPIRVDRLDISSGHRTPWRSFSPAGLLGGGWLTGLVLSANEQAWVVGYDRIFSELLVIDGLK